VLLAGLREDELEQLLDRVTFPRLTTHSVRDRAELLDKVAAARERGWSSSNSETVEGVCGAAAPLKQNGRTVAALLLCGPSEREPVIKGWVPELVRVARDASHAWTAVTSPDTGGVASPAGRVRHADRLDRSASALQPVRPTATANEGFGEGFTSRDDGETVRADASSPRA
ncbi:MAG: IclR family transcriptional regulator C-terminal domain-containing protein, partial [Candidatus Dormibacteraeota bacterium]|nr:IclR family transcriptional regulator C-terminal domain-containing protein [Candidatus Dormibacteraeota bacterium]MBO0762919.1 IclR family transcriptional regulator C-terminal domain-containing protein [Candidatus Dormibacteraeota bacterium]